MTKLILFLPLFATHIFCQPVSTGKKQWFKGNNPPSSFFSKTLFGRRRCLTWGPPVKVNFELATPNSVHGCTLARPTWRRMKKGARVQCARAVHVQVFWTHHFLAALRGTRVAPPIPNSQVARIPYQLKIHCGCHFRGLQVARARGGKPFWRGVLWFKETLS